MSQELEQAVREGLSAIGLESELALGVLLNYLSPLYTRLSQRITEWEERWSKDASQSESECRARDKRIEELERIIQDARIGADLNPHGKTLLDFHQVWLDQAKDRIEELEAERNQLKEWLTQTEVQFVERGLRIEELEAQAGAMRAVIVKAGKFIHPEIGRGPAWQGWQEAVDAVTEIIAGDATLAVSVAKLLEKVDDLERCADSGEVVLDEEEASHQETLRLWQEAKARVAELEAKVGGMRELAARALTLIQINYTQDDGELPTEALRECEGVLSDLLAGDAGKSLLAELVELRAWVERANGVLGQARAAIARETGIWRRGQEDAVEAIDALLFSSLLGVPPEKVRGRVELMKWICEHSPALVADNNRRAHRKWNGLFLQAGRSVLDPDIYAAAAALREAEQKERGQ